jgi:hypothetical protein
MIAATKPFLPKADKDKSDKGKDAPLRSQRPYSLASADETRAGRKSSTDAAAADRSRVLVRSASADPRMETLPTSNFAPAEPRNDGSMLGLISGRGLY